MTGIVWQPNEITPMPADMTEVTAMIYNLNIGEAAKPSDFYLDTIERGCRAVGFHLRCLAEGIRRTQRRTTK